MAMPWSVFGVVLTVVYLSSRCIYNLYFHPLAKFPGPRSCAATRLVFVRWLWSGQLHVRTKQLHDEYGYVVRVAPNELSFIDGQAWAPLYTGRTRNKGLPKNLVVFGSQEFRNVLDGDDDEHTLVRKMLAPGFSLQTLYRQEPLLKKYLRMMTDHLQTLSAKGATVNIVDWFQFLIFDIAGDLTFGESFGQLEKGAFNPWVEMLAGHLKYSAVSIGLRYYPPLDRVMGLVAPPSLRHLKRRFVSLLGEKLHRSIERRKDKVDDDLLSHFLRDDGTPLVMNTKELMGTFSFLIVAGSVTTGTTLAGLINYLCGNRKALEQLQREVRALPHVDDLTIQSTAELPYLTACLKEALRLCYPVPGTLSRVVQEDGIEICGHYVPPHTLVGIPSYASHLSERNFEEPHAFLPERWLHSNSAETEQGIFHPFALGGRSCIGQGLAWAEMRLTIATFVHEFDFEMVSGPSWLQQRTFWFWEKEPCYLQLRFVGKRSS